MNISGEMLQTNLGLLFVASAYNLSKTQIFSPVSRVDVEGLASPEEYQNFWDSIADCGVAPVAERVDLSVAALNRGTKLLWYEVQDAVNDTCRELLVHGNEDFMHLILDDDKMHDASKCQHLACL